MSTQGSKMHALVTHMLLLLSSYSVAKPSKSHTCAKMANELMKSNIVASSANSHVGNI